MPSLPAAATITIPAFAAEIDKTNPISLDSEHSEFAWFLLDDAIDKIFLPSIFKDRDDVTIKGINDYLCKFEKLSKHDNFCFRDSFPIRFVKEFLEKHLLPFLLLLVLQIFLLNIEY